MKTTKQHIIFLSTPQSWRGGENQLKNLILHLSKENLSLTLLCPENSNFSKEKIEHLKIIAVKNTLFSWLKTLKKIRNDHHEQLFHANDSKAHSILVLFNFFKKTPFILHRRVAFKKNKNWLTRYKYQHPQLKHVIFISKKIQKENLPITHKDRQSLIYSSINIDLFLKKQKQKENLKNYHKIFKISKNKKIIANFSALAPDKDHETYIIAIKNLLKTNPEIHALIIGTGFEKNNIISLIKSHKLEQHITLTGFRNDVANILKFIDIFVITSKEEGLGSSILEAFLSKCPVVACNAGGIPELVKHNKTGLLCPIKSPLKIAKNINYLLQNPNIASKLCLNAYTFATKMNSKEMTKKTIKIYENVFNEIKTNI